MKTENKLHNIKEYFESYKNFSIWRLIAYFIIYSVLGFFIETIFGLITKGVVESRKSFLYGPFCAIYGVGAVIMILSLNPFKDNNNRLFFGRIYCWFYSRIYSKFIWRNDFSCKVVGLFNNAFKY